VILFISLSTFGAILGLIILFFISAWLLSTPAGTFVFICAGLWIVWRLFFWPRMGRRSARHNAEQEELHRQAREGRKW
jgi:ABC-type bacteriocin/lantibiotic exporter with double-glycine peptidase domain